MRAAIYARVSTEEQAVHGFSLAEQVSACKKKAVELGAEEILEFADEGISGATLNRPGLEALREAVREGKIDCLILRDPDRLSRRLAHQLLLTEEFEKAGVKLEFLDFEWKDTPEGRLFYSIKGAIAEYEREKIRERMTRGKLQKARQGGIPVNFDVYGYHYDPATGRVSINEEEAATVSCIFNWFTTEDIGIAGVANRLNEMGIPTKRGAGCWHRQVVKQILVNPVYKGEWKYGKVDWHTRTPRPGEEVITIPVPAIVDSRTWDMAQEKLQKIRQLWSKKGRHQYLLSGLLVCADCSNTMGGSFIKWWGTGRRRYTCRRAGSASRSIGCRPLKAIPADVLENAVWEQIKGFLCDAGAIAREAAACMSKKSTTEREYENIKVRLKAIEKGKEKILDALASGLLELDEKTKNKLADLKSRRERLENRKKELERRLLAAGDGAAALEELQRLALRLLERIDDLSFEEKRALIRAVVSQIIVAGRPQPGKADQSMNGVIVTVMLKTGEMPRQVSGYYRPFS